MQAFAPGSMHAADRKKRNLKQMKSSMKLQWTLGLLLVAGQAENILTAAEPAGPAAETRSVTIVYLGKVAAVDRTAMTVTIEMAGQVYLFNIIPTTRLTQQEQNMPVSELVTGQVVRLSIRELANGKIELVSLDVIPAAEASEEAGKAKEKEKSKYAKSAKVSSQAPPRVPVPLPPQVTLPPQAKPPTKVSPHR
jgi:hypothetical protein